MIKIEIHEAKEEFVFERKFKYLDKEKLDWLNTEKNRKDGKAPKRIEIMPAKRIWPPPFIFLKLILDLKMWLSK